MTDPTPRRLEPAHLQALIATLWQQGYVVLGPQVRDGALICDELRTTADLPQGWGDEQAGGHYRLTRREDGAWFGFAAVAQGAKRVLHPPRELLFTARRKEAGFQMQPAAPVARPTAVIGLRACDLAAIAVQDRVFLQGDFTNPGYAARRAALLVVAVNCTDPAGTCFCASMGTGPQVRSGHDLLLTEVMGEGGHYFTAQAGTARGQALLEGLQAPAAQVAETQAAQARVTAAEGRMGRTLKDAPGAKALLQANLHHPQWDAVARRCLACGNCTLVCPTCFCTTTEERPSLDGTESRQERRWDSCFSFDFSYIHGGAVRQSTAARYRQWLTHKLANWHDQFGTSGCVGCGRCIAWCPVGIDLTEELRAIRADSAV